MDSRFTVRTFTDADAAALTVLLHDAYAELGAVGLNFTAVDQDENTTRSRANAGHCWVIEDGARLVATLTVSYPPTADLAEFTAVARAPQRAWLNQVAVAPSHRGLGLARELWTLGQRWALQQGAASMGLDTAVPAEHLVAMYTAWGFERVDTIHWAGKTYDSAIMVRDLGA